MSHVIAKSYWCDKLAECKPGDAQWFGVMEEFVKQVVSLADEAAKAQPAEPRADSDVPEWFAFYIGAEWPAAMFSSELMAKDFTSKLSGMVGDLKRVPSPIVSQSELTRRVEQATADKDKRIAELEKDRDNYRRLFDDAIDAVDEVFQTRSDSAPPILPDFCPLGTSKFRAVVKLAKEYKALKQQLAERDAALVQVAEENWQACVGRAEGAKEERERIVAWLRKRAAQADESFTNNNVDRHMHPSATATIDAMRSIADAIEADAGKGDG